MSALLPSPSFCPCVNTLANSLRSDDGGVLPSTSALVEPEDAASAYEGGEANVRKVHLARDSNLSLEDDGEEADDEEEE